MKSYAVLLAVVVACSAMGAEEVIPVPWQEFKELFQESIERRVREEVETQPERKEPQVYTLNEAVYRLRISKRGAGGQVLVSGRVLSGDPEPILLFDDRFVIANVEQVSGGTLICKPGGRGTTSFLADGANEFQAVLDFLTPAGEDEQSKLVAFGVPPALKNSLTLELDEGVRLLEGPGIADENGTRHFPASSDLMVRFSDDLSMAAAGGTEIDLLSSIRLQGRRVLVTTSFLPMQVPVSPVVLRVAPGMQYVSSSLRNSWLRQLDEQTYEIALPANTGKVFTLQFALEETDPETFTFPLASIRDNAGSEGGFVVEDPDDGRVTIAGDGLVSGIPVTQLAAQLRPAAGAHKSYRRAATDSAVTLSIQRFSTVATPPVVLDSLSFFTSFEENGSVLSTLRMEVPPEVGPRLSIAAVEGADIWSLVVNGQTKRVYSNREGAWILPLARGETSLVELAFVRQARKLGLQGRLDAELPATGLPAHHVHVGLALPARVQLLSVEGPVTPSSKTPRDTPQGFVGEPYHFSREFYRGDGMKLAVSYREPVQRE